MSKNFIPEHSKVVYVGVYCTTEQFSNTTGEKDSKKQRCTIPFFSVTIYNDI